MNLKQSLVWCFIKNLTFLLWDVGVFFVYFVWVFFCCCLFVFSLGVFWAFAWCGSFFFLKTNKPKLQPKKPHTLCLETRGILVNFWETSASPPVLPECSTSSNDKAYAVHEHGRCELEGWGKLEM